MFVDTIMVTNMVGVFGLGNRPGRGDFGGGYLWPYGKREMALPVWAHKRGVQYDRLVFQDCRESSLGWHESHSSREPFYCRPVTPAEMMVDTVTCPTMGFNTDKGIPQRLIDPGRGFDCANVAQLPPKTFYPPRNDIPRRDSTRDWTGVEEYASLNTLDTISRATPAAGQTFKVRYNMPAILATGTYYVYVEVNQEWDQNSSHDYAFFVDPQLQDYGMESIGQPSVVWRIPIEISGDNGASQVNDYYGYGSPTGADGLMHMPDNTITTGVPGSGAGRLAVLNNPVGDYRVRVAFNPDAPCTAPDAIQSLALASSTFNTLTVNFMVPNTVNDFRVKYAYGEDAINNDDDFASAIDVTLPPRTGDNMTVMIDDLQWNSTYTIAVRGYDACGQPSALSTITARTPNRVFATVDACFIATAAYGSKEEAHVVELRAFRDRVMARTELGRDAIQLYYEVSPPIADLVRDHESLRSLVRSMLGPVVSVVRVIE